MLHSEAINITSRLKYAIGDCMHTQSGRPEGRQTAYGHTVVGERPENKLAKYSEAVKQLCKYAMPSAANRLLAALAVEQSETPLSGGQRRVQGARNQSV